jgi:hypothetical protein
MSALGHKEERLVNAEASGLGRCRYTMGAGSRIGVAHHSSWNGEQLTLTVGLSAGLDRYRDCQIAE